jgi:hypothetical protein
MKKFVFIWEKMGFDIIILYCYTLKVIFFGEYKE